MPRDISLSRGILYLLAKSDEIEKCKIIYNRDVNHGLSIVHIFAEYDFAQQIQSLSINKMFIMKYFCIMAVLSAVVLPATASESCLRLTLDDGTIEVYRLGEKPIIIFDNTDLIVSTANVSLGYLRSEVKSIDFISSLGIVDVTGERSIIYSYENGAIACDGAHINVYDLNGNEVVSRQDRVSLTPLPYGTYIVRINDKSIKIHR